VLAIYKTFNCLFYFLQASEVLKRLIRKPFKFAASIMNVYNNWLSTFKILHSIFVILAKPYYFLHGGT
jgi:hypothetical protein